MMSMLKDLPTYVLATEEVVNELPIPSWAVGGGALGLLCVLLLITLSFNKR